jgi:hypothetical protein
VLGDTSANAVLDGLFGSGAPASFFVALSLTSPFSDGTNVTEPDAGNSYARVEVVNDATNWPAASGRQKANGTDIAFPTATGAGWGLITDYVLFDAGTGGNFIGSGALDTPATVDPGGTAGFEAGALVVVVPS